MSCDCCSHVGHWNGINPNSALPKSGLGDPNGSYSHELLPHPCDTACGLYLAFFEEMPSYSCVAQPGFFLRQERNLLPAPSPTRELNLVQFLVPQPLLKQQVSESTSGDICLGLQPQLLPTGARERGQGTV